MATAGGEEDGDYNLEECDGDYRGRKKDGD